MTDIRQISRIFFILPKSNRPDIFALEALCILPQLYHPSQSFDRVSGRSQTDLRDYVSQ